VILDPAWYLASLDADSCIKWCARLATYPWFPLELPELPPSGYPNKAWQAQLESALPHQWPPVCPDDSDAIRRLLDSCLRFQEDFGVTYIVLPFPVIDDPDSNLRREREWLDAAAQCALTTDLPVLLQVAITDSCLITRDPPRNDLLEALVDNLGVRQELSGVYLVLVQVLGQDRAVADHRIAWSLLDICFAMGSWAGQTVVVNYLDDFGLVCTACGATAFGSGYAMKARRINCQDYRQRGGGGAYPRFYSSTTMCEYLPESDLERLRDRKLLRLLQADQTPAAAQLMHVLSSGGRARNVPEWKEETGNTQLAEPHRLQLLHRASQELDSVPAQDKMHYMFQRLQDAERTATYFDSLFPEKPLYDTGRHLTPWRSGFERFMEEHNL